MATSASDVPVQTVAKLSSEAGFRVLTDAMPQMVWSTLPDGFHDYYNKRWYEFTGVPEGSTDGEAWNGMFHHEDQEKAWEVWRHSLNTGDPYEIEYRLRHHSGEYRWTLGRALPVRNDDGKIIRWIGTCTDIHGQKKLSEHNEILSRELSHRIKNIFSVISSLIALSAKGKPELIAFADTLRARISALGKAHDFVRPHSENSEPEASYPTVKHMLEELFEAYPAYEDGLLSITGDDIKIDDQAATPIALVFHELATNSIKYGSLGTANGHVAIEIDKRADDVCIRWTESGGPEVKAEPLDSGFGSRLIDMSVRGQLGGQLEKKWDREGLKVSLIVPLNRIKR